MVVIMDLLESIFEFGQSYWSVAVILLILVLWGILAIFGHRFRAWVVPTFCTLALLGNIWAYYFIASDSRVEAHVSQDRIEQISNRDDVLPAVTKNGRAIGESCPHKISECHFMYIL